MSTNTMTHRAELVTATRTSGSVSWFNVIRSEWTKLWSVRSTHWILLALVLLTVLLSAIISNAVASSTQPEIHGDPTSISLAGLDIGQLAIVVLGVMVISAEYASRSIRTSFVAVPQRLTVLGAKALVLGVVALVAGMITSFAAFLVGQAILSTADLNTQLGDPDVFRAVVGGGLYLAGSAMFGFALGALLRSTAGGISVAVGGLLVLPQLTRMLPGSWGEMIQKYFTSNAGQQVMRVLQTGDQLDPWTGYLVFTLWWMAILVVAALLMRRRDA